MKPPKLLSVTGNVREAVFGKICRNCGLKVEAERSSNRENLTVEEYKEIRDKIIGEAEREAEDIVANARVEVQGIKTLISYEGLSVDELKKSFEYMIDCYLEDCKAENIEPEKAYKGSLNVRIGADTHRILALIAQENNIFSEENNLEFNEKDIAIRPDAGDNVCGQRTDAGPLESVVQRHRDVGHRG